VSKGEAMSKWIKKDLFENFQKEKIEEKDTANSGSFVRSELVWDTPQKGTVESPKVYEGRFLPDPEGEFYKRYYFHFWKSGENWKYVFCPKTHDYKNFCPICSAVSKLYNGTKDDKAQGYQLKKKEKNVANFFIVKDNRDDERDDENKVVNKVKLYEFPSKVEQKVKKEVTNRDEGYGMQIFDPSEEGRNFIINVLSTKKQDDGRTWPDYSTSDFSRRQYALGTDDEIKAIMDTCVSLKGYIDSKETDKDKIVEILKSEFLWDLVETECLAHGYQDVETGAGTTREEAPKREEAPAPQEQETQEQTPQPEPEPVVEQSETVSESTSKLDELDDDALLAELDKM
jgi:hypothetical protein